MPEPDPGSPADGQTIRLADTRFVLALTTDNQFVLQITMPLDEAEKFLAAALVRVRQQVERAARRTPDKPTSGTCDVGTRFHLDDLPGGFVVNSVGLNWVDPCPNVVEYLADSTRSDDQVWNLCKAHGGPIIEAIKLGRQT